MICAGEHLLLHSSLLYYMVDAWHESCTELNFYLLRWLSPQVGQAAIIQLPAVSTLLIENERHTNDDCHRLFVLQQSNRKVCLLFVLMVLIF